MKSKQRELVKSWSCGQWKLEVLNECHKTDFRWFIFIFMLAFPWPCMQSSLIFISKTFIKESFMQFPHQDKTVLPSLWHRAFTTVGSHCCFLFYLLKCDPLTMFVTGIKMPVVSKMVWSLKCVLGYWYWVWNPKIITTLVCTEDCRLAVKVLIQKRTFAVCLTSRVKVHGHVEVVRMGFP